MCDHRNPVQCIVPPHILREIARRGDEGQREWALNTLMDTEKLRGQREILGEMVTVLTATGEKRRTVYDGRHHTALPGVLVRGEGNPPSQDPAVNESYDGAGATYDLYYEVFKRNSVDDRGLRLDSTVHYS